MVDITEVNPRPQANWRYDGRVFVEPLSAAVPGVLEQNQVHQAQLLGQASQAMAPVQLSLQFGQLGDASAAEQEIARQWQGYYRALKEVDLHAQSPDWPQPPLQV